MSCELAFKRIVFMDAARNATTTHAGLWIALLPAVPLKTARELGIYTCLWTLVVRPAFQYS
jgi:hypothetical protein